jgi:peptidyl-prolyl cis-trans isomerase SurA
MQDKTGEQKSGYRILFLKSETKPHKASLETDYAKIMSATKQKKQREEMDKWIALNKDRTFIKISAEYNTCEPIKKWLKAAVQN